MKIRVWAVMFLMLATASIGRTQDSKDFVTEFPSLRALEASLRENVDSQPVEAIEGKSTSMHMGRWAALNGLAVVYPKMWDILNVQDET
jgi:hypothetical protein